MCAVWVTAAWYSVFLNSLVHVFMYSYYLAAVLLAGNEKAKRRYLWWGRYLTMFQMVQFVSMMAQVRRRMVCAQCAIISVKDGH
jgi:hypothetical protein